MPATEKLEVDIIKLSFVPPLSNVAMSDDPGAVVLLAPPEEVDQLVLSQKDPFAGPIQYFVAASAPLVESKNSIEIRIRARNRFM